MTFGFTLDGSVHFLMAQPQDMRKSHFPFVSSTLKSSLSIVILASRLALGLNNCSVSGLLSTAGDGGKTGKSS